ncbi:radical SAM protein, TIGR01212 family [Thiovulum sp. ES]|nr:radical SAM protein, TIGR01212 family [Thiovulum sp. ES]
MKEILTFGKYLKRKFGSKVTKVPIALSGFTCPNIDGKTARGGCTFCENESFNPTLNSVQKVKGFSLNMDSKTNPLLEKQLGELRFQFKTISEKLEKEGTELFLVYFQAFTNTYAPIETLKKLYREALSFPNVVGLSIGTRSDSVSDEVLDFLAELSKEKEIWIEFGIQSIYDETLQKINRGHDYKSVEWAITESKKRNLNVCGHLIYGLPDENSEMMQNSFQKSLELGVDSIKIHPLYVVERTALANKFRVGEFTPISEEEYIKNVIISLKNLPENVSMQRISAGIENDTLLSPDWCFNKQKSFGKIRKALHGEGLLY